MTESRYIMMMEVVYGKRTEEEFDPPLDSWEKREIERTKAQFERIRATGVEPYIDLPFGCDDRTDYSGIYHTPAGKKEDGE